MTKSTIWCSCMWKARKVRNDVHCAGQQKYGGIKILPAWHFLLDQKSSLGLGLMSPGMDIESLGGFLIPTMWKGAIESPTILLHIRSEDLEIIARLHGDMTCCVRQCITSLSMHRDRQVVLRQHVDKDYQRSRHVVDFISTSAGLHAMFRLKISFRM